MIVTKKRLNAVEAISRKEVGRVNDRIDGIELQISTLVRKIESEASSRAFQYQNLYSETVSALATIKRAIDDIGAAGNRTANGHDQLDSEFNQLLEHLGLAFVYEGARTVTVDGDVTEHEPARTYIAKTGRRK